MQITSVEENNVVVVSVVGRMDATTNIEFETECKTLIQAGKTKLLINLEGLEYISSAGLRGVLTIVKLIKQQNGTICFCALQSMVNEVFKVSGFTSMLSIFPTQNEALLSIKE